MKNNWPPKAVIGDVELIFDSTFRGDCGENFAYYKTKGGTKLTIERVQPYGLTEPEYHLRSPIYHSPRIPLRGTDFLPVMQGDGDGI